MYRTIKVRSQGINWYTRSTIELVGKMYTIIDCEWDGLVEYWFLKVKASK